MMWMWMTPAPTGSGSIPSLPDLFVYPLRRHSAATARVVGSGSWWVLGLPADRVAFCKEAVKERPRKPISFGVPSSPVHRTGGGGSVVGMAGLGERPRRSETGSNVNSVNL